jgi:hypothetical protein
MTAPRRSLPPLRIIAHGRTKQYFSILSGMEVKMNAYF